jgi:hypothetical protein
MKRAKDTFVVDIYDGADWIDGYRPLKAYFFR